jgi:glucose/arabinose dehydrogenase
VILPLLLATAAALAADESDYYTVDFLKPPEGAVLEVGGLDFLPDGRLVVSTRRGQVWIVEDALAADPAAAKFTLFAEGLWEGMGLKVVDGDIYVLQRQELSRLVDEDHDGTCDRIDTLCDAWGVSGNYHEFAFGLPLDRDGNFCVSLNVGFTDPMWWHQRSLAPWRGWVLKVDRRGHMTPFASGFRSPCGIATNADGDLFVTDNQGDWVPVCSINHVEQGRFYGAPASLKWAKEYQDAHTEPSLTNPVATERTPPAVWVPYGWSRSTGDLAPMPKDGSFGPFGPDQLAVAEMTNGLLLRADLEKVRGRWQGCVIPFRKGVGAAIRTRFAPDGTLLLGLTNRGWGGRPPGQGIARVRWTGRAPLEIAHVKLFQDGFEVAFTQPLAAGTAVKAEDVLLRRNHYDWWWEYGSPERDRRVLSVDSVTIAPDRRTLTLRSRELECGAVATVKLPPLRSESGEPLLHDEFAYTVNELPEGGPCSQPVARVAPPPPARESEDQGWLRLCYSDAFQLWASQGWALRDVEQDLDHPERLALRDGVSALVNAGAEASAFTSRPVFGDAKVHVDF